LEEFYHSIGLATDLKGIGIDQSRLEEMADKCTNSGQVTVGNFVKSRKIDVLKILNLSII